jgi:hypothetical protein
MPKSNVLTENAFQISLVGAILFLVLAHPILFNFVSSIFSMVGIELNDTLLTIVHSLVFAVAIFYSIKVVVMLD